MRLLWMTDLHLDRYSINDIERFCECVVEHYFFDVVILTGDISNAIWLKSHLDKLSIMLRKPIYFVLGNHDFYGSSFEYVKKSLKDLRSNLHYLSDTKNGVNWLIPNDTCLIGHDSWYDGGYGNYSGSNLILNDINYISNFYLTDKDARLQMYRKLSLQAVTHISKNITNCIKNHAVKNIIIAMHVPPFEEVCLYNSKPSSEFSLPFFTNKIMGDMLREKAEMNPDIMFTVLCGHTHDKCEMNILNNLNIRVGGETIKAIQTDDIIVDLTPK